MSIDRKYWDDYYAEEDQRDPPSPFAVACADIVTRGGELLELGCGSGRDLMYFNELGVTATGYDSSEEAVLRVNRDMPGSAVLADFTRLPLLPVSYVYSRWTLHALDDAQEQRVLQWASRTLPVGGYFLIEARTTSDPRYGVGEQAGKHAFVDTHYRRFIDPALLERNLTRLGFHIEMRQHSAGLSGHGNDAPVLLRLVARKCRDVDTPGIRS